MMAFFNFLIMVLFYNNHIYHALKKIATKLDNHMLGTNETAKSNFR